MRTRVLSLVTILVLAGTSVQARDKESDCDWHVGITETRIDQSDAALYAIKGDSRRNGAIAKHLPFGRPKHVGHFSRSNEFLLTGPYFVVRYDADLRAPLWTAHRLTREEAALSRKTHPGKAEKRKNSFRSDPRLEPDERAFCSDFKEPVFDQGHMVPNADLDWIDPNIGYSLGMDHSFLMSNMTAQHCEFNRGPWWVLEDLTRKWAANAAETWIVAGTIFDWDGELGRDPDVSVERMKNHIGISAVAVPSHLYRIIIQRDGNNWKTLSFILPNDETLITNDQRIPYLEDKIVTLAEIESMSGLRFLNDKTVSQASSLWPFAGCPKAVMTWQC